MESGTYIMSSSGEAVSGSEVNTLGEDHCSEPDQDSVLKSHHGHDEGNDNIIADPELGMEFETDAAAVRFYNSYAGKIGFKVRKQHLKRSKTGAVTRRRLCCSKEGQKKDDKRRPFVLYRQPVSRVGCKAHMTCLLQKNGKYRVVSFDRNHNHELGRTSMRNLLMTDQLIMTESIRSTMVPIRPTIELTGKEVGGYQHLGFTDTNSQSYNDGKQKMTMEKGDAGSLMQYLQKMQLENPAYFYSIQLDDNDMIKNVFWADARSVSDYSLFGDAVCFDTTYRINDYGRPFASIIGVNHHRQTTVFGAAFIYDEAIDSFKWLFKTFLAAMSGKQPKTILTDQSDAMAKAISEVFPKTHHGFCLWHIYQSVAKSLSHLFNGSNQFPHDLIECIYGHEDEDEWLSAWNGMLEKYNLKENAWFHALFEAKEKWALAYGRHTFIADMKTTQRGESMNTVLKEYLKPKLDISILLENYEKALADYRYEEQIADFKMTQGTPVLLASVEMLRHGVEVYTPEVFTLFQKEYMSILNCSVYKVCKYGTTYQYKVIYGGKPKEHLVKFEASTCEVVCSCMKFTFVGILCAHALKVLDKKNVKNIPPLYIMTRWTREAKTRNFREDLGSEIPESSGKRYDQLFHKFREIASIAAENESLTSYAHDRSIELLKNLQEMKKNIQNQAFHCGNGSQSSFATHAATATLHEKFGPSTIWQFDKPLT